MKTLATFAFLAVLTLGVSANADMTQKLGYQNFLYYFGKPCPCAVANPCEMPSPCEPACPKVDVCDPCAS